MARNWIAYGWAAIKADDAREARELALLQEHDWNVTEVSPIDYPQGARISGVGAAWAAVGSVACTIALSVFLKLHTGNGIAGFIVDTAQSALTSSSTLS